MVLNSKEYFKQITTCKISIEFILKKYKNLLNHDLSEFTSDNFVSKE